MEMVASRNGSLRPTILELMSTNLLWIIIHRYPLFIPIQEALPHTFRYLTLP